MLRRSDSGFTLIEITIAILILTAAVLGIAASTGQMLGPAADADLDFQALQAVEDRLAQIRLDPRYALLDSIYTGTLDSIPGLPGLSRKTTITRSQTTMTGGKVWDYTKAVVIVYGGRLKSDVYRMLIIGAP